MKRIFLLVLLTLIITSCSSDNLNTYTDVNYPFSIGYTDDFEYEISNQNVIFESDIYDSFYVATVLLSSTTGGKYNTLKEVQTDYLMQFEEYGVNLIGSVSGKINGFDALDFLITYSVEDVEYQNRFVIGKDKQAISLPQKN